MEEKKRLYNYLQDCVYSGHAVVFDFKTLNIKVDKELVVENGHIVKAEEYYFPDTTEYMCKDHDAGLIDAWGTYRRELNYLYRLYKHSIPSANEPARPYFKALKYDELSEDDKTHGSTRDRARFELEYMVYLLAAGGRMPELIGNGYFWRSIQDPDFVIMKSWFNL